MRTVSIVGAALLASAQATFPAFPVHAEGRDAPVTAEAWAARLLDEAVGRGDPVTREAYRARAEGYVRFRSAFAREAYGRRLSGRPERAARAEVMIERVIEDARRLASGTEDSLFALIDPRGNGSVPRSEALRALADAGRPADLDGDGRLDRTERDLAEAAVAARVDISDPARKDSLLRALELSAGFLD